MSSPGFPNLNSSASYSQNSTANGGAAPPYQNGKAGRLMRLAGSPVLACELRMQFFIYFYKYVLLKIMVTLNMNEGDV